MSFASWEVEGVWTLGMTTIFAGAILEGLSRAWYSGNNDAFLYDSVTQSKNKGSFAHHLGKTSSMFQLALMIGAVTGSIMAQWSFSLIMWLSVIPQIVCLIISFTLLDPQRFTKGKANIFSHIKIAAKYLWNNKRLKLLSLSEILQFGIGEASFNFNAAFIGTLWPIWAIGFSRMISYGGAFISFWYSGKFIKRIGEYNILIYSNIYTRIMNVIAYGYPTVFSPLLMGSASVWYGANQVSRNSLMQKEYSQRERATLSSMSSFFGSIFFGFFAPLLGVLADIYGPAKALLFAQLCMLSVLAINIKLKQIK